MDSSYAPLYVQLAYVVNTFSATESRSWDESQNSRLLIDWCLAWGQLDLAGNERITKLQYVFNFSFMPNLRFPGLFALPILAAENLIGPPMEFQIKFLKLALKMRNFRIIDGTQKSISVFAIGFAALPSGCCVFWAHKSMQFRKLHL